MFVCLCGRVCVCVPVCVRARPLLEQILKDVVCMCVCVCVCVVCVWCRRRCFSKRRLFESPRLFEGRCLCLVHRSFVLCREIEEKRKRDIDNDTINEQERGRGT